MRIVFTKQSVLKLQTTCFYKLYALLPVFILLSIFANAQTTFTYTGAMQTFTVPPGVTTLTVEAWGGQGANSTDVLSTPHVGGLGSYSRGTLAVTPGQILYIFAGGAGSTLGTGGFNGGGTGGTSSPGSGCSGGASGGGGGASDIRAGGTALSNRVIIGAGGGGAGRDYCNGSCVPCGCGGSGGSGDSNGHAAGNCGFSYPGTGINFGGKGLLVVSSNFGPGDGAGPSGTSGTLGTGGTGASGSYDVAGGGGGGGYYGGGGGGAASSGSGVGGGGGGGGSSYIGGVTSGLITPNVNTGNGYVTITGCASPVGPISGLSSLCVGTTITLTDTTSAGSWSASNAHATVSSGGIVTGVSGGTDTISYSITTGCGISSAIKIITINPLPNAGTITGIATVCVGAITTLADLSTGGVWSASNTNATVVGGVVTGVNAGTDIITYTVTNVCGTASTSITVTINPLPVSGTISGPSSFCIPYTITLTDLTTGGTWSTSTTLIAIVSGSGVVTGVSSGTATISYTVANSCGSVSATYPITVNAIPSPGTITGLGTVCVPSTITLTDLVTGGTWSASNTNATVSGGVVTGVAIGTDIISYTVTNTCGSASATKVITINALSSLGSITGTTTLCVLDATTLSDITTGGTWSSSTTGVASITGTGVVIGVSAGISIISYSVTNFCGTTVATTIVTVNPLPNAGTITGIANTCVGFTSTLNDAVPAGVWLSSSTSVATVSSTGVVSGLSPGITIISYSNTNSCGTVYATKVFTVNPLPPAIDGTPMVCLGDSTLLTDSITGGTWISGSTSIATVNSSGYVYAVAPGTVTITYMLPTGCYNTISVNTNFTTYAGYITGDSIVCAASTITLTDTTAGGTWSVSNGYASVSSTGVVTGLYAGLDTVGYSVSNSCGTTTATFLVSINPLPAIGSIIGPESICVDSLITYIATTIGGVWSATNANAIISSSGVAMGVTVGTDTIIYDVTNVCGSFIAYKLISIITCYTEVNDENLSKISSIKVYPNPNSGFFTIELPEIGNATIIITDLLGNVVSTRSENNIVNKQITFDLSNLATGAYFVKVNEGGNVYHEKIIIVR